MMSMSGQGDAVFASLQGTQQTFAARFNPGRRLDQRNVHHRDDKLVLRNELQVIFDERQLLFAQAGTVHLLIAITEPVHIVHSDEVYVAVVERVVWRPVHAFVRFVAQFIHFGRKVDVMITDDVVPGDADMTECSVETVEQTEVIEQDVAQSHAE